MIKTESVAVAYSPEDNGKGQIIIPINAAIKIFTFLTRNDIENCKLVCTGWKQLVDFADKQLPKRPIDAVALSSNHEYTISIYYRQFRRVYCYRKYFYDRDIDEIELKINNRMSQLFDERIYRFPCGESFPRVSDNMDFNGLDHMHDLACRKRKRFIIYHRRNNYSRKLFTPPLGFYERLKKMLHNGYVKRLVFESFTFTDLFVEKFFEYLNLPFTHLDVVYIHFCSFRRISSESFHNLLDLLSSKQYFIDKSIHCLSKHVSKPLLDKHSIKLAEVFFFGSAFARNLHLRDDLFPIDNETFLNFTNTLSAYPNVSRKFFGIAQCRITSEFLRHYGKLVEQAQQNNLVSNRLDQQKKNFWLFKHVIFGNFKYKVDF